MLACFLLLFPVSILAQGDLPDTPKLVVVSWDHSSDDFLVRWEASKDPTVDLYRMYIPDGDSWRSIYTFGSDTNEYPITNNDYKGLTYIVTAIDTLDGTDERESPLGENPHRAIEVSIEFDPCVQANIINWTGYVGWKGSLSGYQIFGGIKGDEMKDLGIANPTTFTKTHYGVSYDTVYNYYVIALNSTDTSFSQIEEVETSFPDAPELLRVDEVSVIDDNSLELHFTADVDGPVNNFRIWRRNSPGSPYQEIETIWNSSQSVMTYIDHITTLSGPYEYMVESIYQPEGCNKIISMDSSNIGTSVLLDGQLDGQFAQLTWTQYESYESGLSGYRIQRKSDSGEFIDISSVGAEVTSWQESIESIDNHQAGEIQYKIQALSNQVDGDEPGISESNVVSVFMETNIQMPNAFTPGQATNYLFKPLIDFSPKKYMMVIYDRGGRKLFETSDYSQAWDGTFDGGNFAMEGVYVYFIQYTDYTGLSRTLSGNVTVIYPSQY